MGSLFLRKAPRVACRSCLLLWNPSLVVLIKTWRVENGPRRKCHEGAVPTAENGGIEPTLSSLGEIIVQYCEVVLLNVLVSFELPRMSWCL